MPSNVKLGAIFTRPHLSGGANATCTFWRSVENVEVMRDFSWTVSQSTSARRLLIDRTSKYISDIGNTNFTASPSLRVSLKRGLARQAFAMAERADADIPTLTTYPAARTSQAQPAMVILPGGGYGGLAGHEGRDYALFLNREGVHGFVVAIA